MIHEVQKFVFSCFSKSLNETIVSDVFYPSNLNSEESYPMMVMNDGQDMEKMEMEKILHDCWRKEICKPFILVAPHAIDRLQIYGVSGHPDALKRGLKAEQYGKFVVDVLIPEICKRLDINNVSEFVIGGFSLGGLSAFDIAWNHSNVFSKIMACSASFWWRAKELNNGYTDADRIMHQVVRETQVKPNLKIWIQCGTLDENSDRNNNGIIDSIDDSLDLVVELEKIGFEKGNDLSYNELVGGRHSLETYGIAIPYFFHWAFESKVAE